MVNISVISKVDVKGKRVLIRVNYDVPLDKSGNVTNSLKINASMETIKYCLDGGAKSVVLMSHLGRPRGQVKTDLSLSPIVPILEKALGKKVLFLDDCVGSKVEQECADPATGSVILLENLFFHAEEMGSGKDAAGKKFKPTEDAIKAFRTSLTKLGDIYCNDCLEFTNRSPSSMVGINLPQKTLGLTVKKELFSLDSIQAPPRPFLAIIGGPKLSEKSKLILQLIDRVDSMILGGGMVYTFKKTLETKIGDSLCENDYQTLAKELITKAKNSECFLPVDYEIADKFSNDANVKTCSRNEDIPDGWMGLDCGPKSIERYKNVISKAKTIIWCGAMGVYEFGKFENGTKSVMAEVVKAAANGTNVILVGDDTLDCAIKYNAVDKVSHVSIGSASTLDYLTGKELPGIMALSKNI